MPANDSPGNDAQSSWISARVAQILQEGSVGALATLIEAGSSSGHVGSKLLIEEFQHRVSGGSLGDAALDRAATEQAVRFLESRVETRAFQVIEFAPDLTNWSAAQILFERIQAEPRLVICGAGHVGESLAKLASLMSYRATLIDDRAEFVTPDRFSEDNIELIVAQTWSDAVKQAVGSGHGVAVAIVTRGHSEDEQCLRAVMNVDADYVGLIGSKRRTNIVLQRLRESGADEARLRKVHAPVGLDIGAVTPEEVALAIMAEIVAVRRGGEGGSLSAWRRNTNERGKAKG
jgi:xanthine dehydrogenase accessory factor